MSPPRRKLPIGIQTFGEIRNEGYYYVDKTAFALRLIEQGKYYFLSRPRRFGKSLFLDTLKELFEGNQILFQGLHAERHWDWSVRYPVIRISFGEGVLQSRTELDEKITEILSDNEARLGVRGPHRSVSGRLHGLIRAVHAHTGQRAVVLIDEYDKPLLDNITDADTALAMREGLENLYSVLKDADADLRFVLLTGVSKFSKVSLFSGLNNLQDLTLDPRYGAICGYTDADVDTVFAAELDGLDRDEIRRWYNGYNWLGETVYNPFDVLLLFDRRQFQSWWFETGTPTFLVRLLAERRQFTPELERMIASEALLSTFDVDTLPSEALLFQTGYLTIAASRYLPGRLELRLRYPNLEVKSGLNDSLLQVLSGNPFVPTRNISHLYDLLRANDLAGLKDLFHAFYASISNDWYGNSPIAQYEGYYASVFYSYFAALGLDIVLEDVTQQGRIDITVRFNSEVYLFEFKVVESTPKGRAIEQLRNKRYADKYRALNQPIHLIGVEFSKQERTIVGFEVEKV